jgi:hypothetical protein
LRLFGNRVFAFTKAFAASVAPLPALARERMNVVNPWMETVFVARMGAYPYGPTDPVLLGVGSNHSVPTSRVVGCGTSRRQP